MQDFLTVHELNPPHYLRVVLNYPISLMLVYFHHQILQRAAFTQFHHHKNTIPRYLVVDVPHNVGVFEDLEGLNFLDVLGVIERLFDGDRLEVLVGSDDVALPDVAVAAGS